MHERDVIVLLQRDDGDVERGRGLGLGLGFGGGHRTREYAGSGRVDAHRRRTRALVASNVALGQRLDVRTHELSTLQDLSIGLASKSGL